MKNAEKKRNLKKKKWKSNRELYACTVLFLGLFAGLFYYLCTYVNANNEALFNNSYNSRQSVLATQNRRGTIYAADGQVLARTVEEEEKQVRQYPFGEVFAHVVGYSTKGKTGIEGLENYWLSNSHISDAALAANEAAGVKNPGNDVYTTLDPVLQQAAYDAMGVYQGAVVVTEVKTGRILAMVSKPDFDPNQIAGIWEQVSQDQDKAVLLNRATQGLYPPGSTFKIVTALAFIRQFPDQLDSYRYTCSGAYSNGENRISCYHGSVHGEVNFMTSFAKSCNSSFANIGMQLDRAQFGDTIDSLLFNQKLPMELPYNQAVVQLGADSTDEEVIQTSIGQGKTQVTPLLLNLITAAIANDGALMQPYLVERVENAQGRVLESCDPALYRQLMTQEEAAILQDLMEDVVKEGTGKKLNGLSYTAAGKTGSAEFNDVKEDSHAWFTGFAPAEDPRIAVTVIVERIGSGGDYAVPLAKRIFDAYFAEE